MTENSLAVFENCKIRRHYAAWRGPANCKGTKQGSYGMQEKDG